jgi:hypothetical protein
MATPVLKDSRLGPGTLTIGATEYGVQISNVRLTPDVSTEDGTPTLGIPEPSPLSTIAWKLAGSAIQDWEEDAGFVNYCMDNGLAEVAFVWVPLDDATVQYEGTCQILPVEIGGDVAVQQTTDFEFPVIGTPTRSAHVPTVEAAGRSSRSSKAAA